jgi:5-(aminomethyl)-3-furanmethanol phosphate kinase
MAAAGETIGAAIARQPPHCRRRWLVSGHTAEHFLPLLVPGNANTQLTALADWIGPELTRVAPAYACAVLRQHLRPGAHVQPPALPAARCATSVAVVKVGGSLLQRKDLPHKLQHWLTHQMHEQQINLIIGGGGVIDSLRQLDQIHQIDAAAMHWQCVHALRVTMQVVAQWLPEVSVIGSPAAFAKHCWQRPAGVFLIAPDAFYHPSSGDSLPCNWTTTSDSIAALLAQRLSAERLVLLKSCEIVDPHDLNAAAAGGIVDPVLPGMTRAALAVELVSF